jgi:DNA-binding NarL/FixJ family response regulator
MKKVLIIEDAPHTRNWLHEVVSDAFPDAAVSDADTVKMALNALQKESYCLALVDLGLPDGSGLEVLRWLQRNHPQSLSVVLTVMNEDEMLLAAFSAGAQGYLLKEQSRSEVKSQLLGLRDGAPILSPTIAKRLVEHFRQTGPARAEDSGVTMREKEILALIGRGYRNKDVAEALRVSENTVASHVKSIYGKLNISSRAEASWYATKFGL